MPARIGLGMCAASCIRAVFRAARGQAQDAQPAAQGAGGQMAAGCAAGKEPLARLGAEAGLLAPADQFTDKVGERVREHDRVMGEADPDARAVEAYVVDGQLDDARQRSAEEQHEQAYHAQFDGDLLLVEQVVDQCPAPVVVHHLRRFSLRWPVDAHGSGQTPGTGPGQEQLGVIAAVGGLDQPLLQVGLAQPGKILPAGVEPGQQIGSAAQAAAAR